MTDRFTNPDGSCPSYQPADRIIMPAAQIANSAFHRMISKAGWIKLDQNDSWAGHTPWTTDEDGAVCMVYEVRGKKSCHGKYSAIYDSVRLADAIGSS